MEKILKVHCVNDYARYIGAEELHPLISGHTIGETSDLLGFEYPQPFMDEVNNWKLIIDN